MLTDEHGILYTSSSGSNYQPTDYEIDGSYIVFEINNGDSVVLTESSSFPSWIWIVCGAAGATVIVIIIIIIRSSRKKKASAFPIDTDSI